MFRTNSACSCFCWAVKNLRGRRNTEFKSWCSASTRLIRRGIGFYRTALWAASLYVTTCRDLQFGIWLFCTLRALLRTTELAGAKEVPSIFCFGGNGGSQDVHRTCNVSVRVRPGSRARQGRTLIFNTNAKKKDVV